jgi:hypothetical protein
VCDLETSRMGALYIYDISRLRVKEVILGALTLHPASIVLENESRDLLDACLHEYGSRENILLSIFQFLC